MNKYTLYDYEPKTLYGENLADALLRQRILKTPKRYRRIDTGINDPTIDRYIYENYGSEEIRIKSVIETYIPEDSTRGGNKYETAICELENGRIVEIDAILDDRGRPPIYGDKMHQTAVWLPEEQLEWLKKQGNISEKVRELISKAMGE